MLDQRAFRAADRHPLSLKAREHAPRMALAAMARPPWTANRDGVHVAVRLTPRGGRDAIDGVEELADGRVILKIRVRATPSEGEANAALVRFLARCIGVAPSRVRVAAGATARIKRIEIVGDGAGLAAVLEKIAG
jgi:uncharacterized protein (TIGR00251 family)